MANKRDLSEDLRICEAASEGPWWYEEVNADHCGKYVNIHRVIMDFGYSPDIDDQSACGGYPPCAEDDRFIAEARAGWPHAIKRAISAEAELPAARALLIDMRKRAVSAESEVERLRAVLYAMDDGYNPTIPRSVMARMAKEALDLEASYVRGHKVECVDGDWIYCDTGKQVSPSGTYTPRPCARCGKGETERGHDACIANLPGVVNACCGHGTGRGYVMFEDGRIIRGHFTVEEAMSDEQTED